MIKSRNKTTVRNGAARKMLLAAAKSTRGSYVDVGVAADAEPYPNGVSVAQVAAMNEFGTEDIPERPFLRTALKDNESAIASDRTEALTKMAVQGWSAAKALGMMGLRIQLYIQNQIKSNMPPANSQATQDRKRRLGVAQRTLIETEHLLKSITYHVVVKGGGSHGE